MRARLTARTIQSLQARQVRYEVRDTDLQGFVLRVSPSGAMVYSCDFYRPDGRRTRVTIGNTLVLTPAQARDEAVKVLAELAQGRDPAVDRKLAKQETLECFIEQHYREARLRVDRKNYSAWLMQRNHSPYPDLENCVFADYLKPMVVISLNTGVRRGELFSLQWQDVDFQSRQMTVVGATAKSGRSRHIPLNTEAHETLLSWRGQQSTTTGLVFQSASGARFDKIRSSWENLIVAARIHAFRWHDLRHHFASALVMCGVDLNTVRELLGHSDLKMTLRYAHLAPQVKADAVERLESRKSPQEVSIFR